MKTAVTELPESRVRIDVGVDPDVVAKRMERAAGELARDMRLPGFRKGKVPAQLVIQRVGREAVLEQALQSSLPEWYERALIETGVSTVGDPKLDVPKLPEPGESLEFSIEIGVRPQAELGKYKGLEVGRADVEVPDDAVDAEIERLREGFGSLNPVEREAREGDIVSIDYRGRVDGEEFEGGSGTDQLVELGSGSLVEGFEEGLLGARAGDEREVSVSFPDDYRAEELAGKDATFAVTVKEVREKVLPELSDDFASDASEFETLGELRDAIRERIAHTLEHQAEDQFRAAAVDAAAAEARIELPDEIVRARATDMWERIERSLQGRGISPDSYLKMQGKSREELIDEARPEAERALRREATLAAVAEAEDIEVSDDELLEALGPGEGEEDPKRLLDRLRSSGRDALLREEVRLRKAADVIVHAAKPIPAEQAAAREAIWTPEKGEADREGEAGAPAAEPGKIWTPGA